MVRHKHYCTQVIEGVIDGRLEHSPAESTSHCRWLSWANSQRFNFEGVLRQNLAKTSGVSLIKDINLLEKEIIKGPGWLSFVLKLLNQPNLIPHT